MRNKLVSLLHRPFNHLILLAIIFFVLPSLVGNFIGDSPIKRVTVSLITFIFIILITEFLFRFFYRLYCFSLELKSFLYRLYLRFFYGLLTVYVFRCKNNPPPLVHDQTFPGVQPAQPLKGEVFPTPVIGFRADM